MSTNEQPFTDNQETIRNEIKMFWDVGFEAYKSGATAWDGGAHVLSRRNKEALRVVSLASSELLPPHLSMLNEMSEAQMEAFQKNIGQACERFLRLFIMRESVQAR